MTFTDPGKPAAEPMNITNRLAYERTHLALERTMQAWIRTALSLISFGFTINKFFLYLAERGSKVAVPRLVGPERFGIGMIVVGLICLLLATVQHVLSMRQMRREYPATPRSLAAVLAGLVSLLGLCAIASVLSQ